MCYVSQLASWLEPSTSSVQAGAGHCVDLLLCFQGIRIIIPAVYYKCTAHRNPIETRKSSCVNGRGIPTAAYQVLLGGVPPPPPARSDRGGPEVGYPPHRGTPRPGLTGRYPRWGTPHQGTPSGQV